MITFGERLRRMRRSKCFSQTKLSTATGVPQTTISDWENDKYVPDIIRARRLANVLGVSLLRLFDKEM